MIHRSASTLLAVVFSGVLLGGQVQDPKSAFSGAVGQFSLALEGAFGDEGPRLRSSLGSMRQALAEWDAALQKYEGAIAADLPTAAPALAGRMHLAMAGLYFDRSRTADGLRELDAARRADQGRADLALFEALAQSQLAGNEAAATTALRRAAALGPDDPVAAYLLARSLSRAGSTTEADQAYERFAANETRRTAKGPQALTSPFADLTLFRETAGVEPFFPPVLYAEGFAELQHGRHAQAIDAFQRAVARDPLGAQPGLDSGAMGRAAAAFRNGSLDTALEHLAVAIELSPDRAEPHRILGLVHTANREPDAAVGAFEAAVRLDPRDERARLGLADALLAAGRLPAARQSLQDTLALLPGSGRARYRLARVYQQQGLYPDAVKELTGALESKPMLGLNSIYQTLGALARAQQQYDAAITAFSRRVDLVPNNPDAHQELGEMYFRQSRHGEALAEFMATVMLDPSRLAAHTAIGQVHLRTGRFAEAASAARRALALDGTHREARYVLATSLIRLGNADEGRRELEIYQRLQAEATAARSRQLEIEGLRRDASFSMTNGEYEKAIDLLRRVLDRDPGSAVSHLELGVALLQGGRAQEAIEHLSAAASDDDEDAHAYLADAYAAAGRSDDAERERAIARRIRQEALRRAGAGR